MLVRGCGCGWTAAIEVARVLRSIGRSARAGSDMVWILSQSQAEAVMVRVVDLRNPDALEWIMRSRTRGWGQSSFPFLELTGTSEERYQKYWIHYVCTLAFERLKFNQTPSQKNKLGKCSFVVRSIHPLQTSLYKNNQDDHQMQEQSHAISFAYAIVVHPNPYDVFFNDQHLSVRQSNTFSTIPTRRCFG